MFDNTSSKSQTPPGNLPTGADSSSIQSSVDKGEAMATPQDPPKQSASPIRHDGQIEDIFASTDQASNQSNTSDFKVSSVAQESTAGHDKSISTGQSALGAGSPNLYSSGQAASAVSTDHRETLGQLASPPVSLNRGETLGGPTHFLSGSGLKSKPDNGLGSGNLTPDKIEFSDDKLTRKKYFIIGLIGLLVVGGGALAYWLLVLNKPLELDSSLNVNSPAKAPVNTQIGNPQVPTQVTSPNPVPIIPAVIQPDPTTVPAEQVKPETKPPEPALSDLDQDGLLDSEEVALKTNPRKADTDGDGLFDREEVKVYFTDPNNPDTDGDGYLDGEEVANGFNPNGEGKLLPEIGS